MFGILHIDGSGEDNPNVSSLPGLYDELLRADKEHGDVSVINDDTGWSISVFRGGVVVMEKLGSRGSTARHMTSLTKEQVLLLWSRLIRGDVDGLLSEPWTDGYGGTKEK